MKNIIRWINANMRAKRWLLLNLFGISLLCYSIAKIINYKTLSETGDILTIIISFIIGFTAIIISNVFIQKKMLELLIEDSDTRKETNNINTLIFNKKVYHQGPKIVVIGGGRGLNTVLRGLKHYTDNITAIVTVSDYGETPTDSKKALKVLPIDDIKESIIALSDDENEMKNLMDCTFEDGKLEKLSFGDIYFLAMNQVYKNFSDSVKNSDKILNTTGTVLPVTLEPIIICAELDDGTVIENKEKIPEIVSSTMNTIGRIYIRPTNCKPAPGVIEAIREADAIVIGPGSLYTNVIPNLLVNGVAREIKNSKAIKVYVSNIMTELGQTDNFTLSDHIKALNEYIGEEIVDYCIYDTGEIIPEFIHLYNLKGSEIVLPDIAETRELGIKVIQRNLSKIDGDIIIHDSDVIASTIIQLVCDELEFQDMQNDSQFMMLNSKLKETEREIRKREKKERKFKKSGRKIFERRKEKSKFKNKYQERIESIKESDIEKDKTAKLVEADKNAKRDLMEAVKDLGIKVNKNKGKHSKD